MKIDIYTGHENENGTDHGAAYGKLIEHPMAAATAKGCFDSLSTRGKAKGIQVRIEKGNMSIAQATAAANKWGADILLDFHYNAGGGNRGEVIHSIRTGSKELADIVALGLKDAGQSPVTVRPDTINGVDKFGMLRLSKCKACIVEVCFIDNPADSKDFDTYQEQYNAGVCIARRIMSV